jgi:hypothetical protein
VICLSIAIAGCVSTVGPGSGAASPTATNTPGPLSGVNETEFRNVESLSSDARAGFREARNGDEWVLVNPDVAESLGPVEYVRADGQLWKVGIHIGTKMVDANPTNETRDSAVEYTNLTAPQQRLFRNAVEHPAPYELVPSNSLPKNR